MAAADLFFSVLRAAKGRPFRYFYAGKVQILMFHRVVASMGKNRIVNEGIEVTEKYLEQLINYYLEQDFIPASIDELPRLLKEKNNKRYVIFTFDDGYLDNYEKALPVFEKYNIPFAVYITTDFIERKQFAWWYFLEDVIAKNEKIVCKHQLSTKEISCKTAAEKEKTFIALREQIQASPSVLSAFIELYSPDLKKYHDLFLTETQLVTFSKHPLVTIGSHTVSHISLAKSSDEQVHHEITDSKSILEKMIGKKVEHFAYPFGTAADVGEREIKLAEKAGYVTALTTAYGAAAKDTSLFALPRIWTSESHTKRDLIQSSSGYNSFRMK